MTALKVGDVVVVRSLAGSSKSKVTVTEVCDGYLMVVRANGKTAAINEDQVMS